MSVAFAMHLVGPLSFQNHGYFALSMLPPIKAAHLLQPGQEDG